MAKKKEKKGGDFGRTNRYAPRVKLVETYYEDIEVIQPDGSVTIQKDVKIERYATINTLSVGASVGNTSDILDELEGCDGYEDEEEESDD